MRPAAERRGFTLPAVLAVTGVVTLVFMVAVTALASLNAEAAAARARIQFLQRALTAEAALAYLVATEPMNPQGLQLGASRVYDSLGPVAAPPPAPGGPPPLPPGQLRLDSRPYLMDVDGPLVLRLQDQAGLINLATLDGDQTRRLVEMLGGAGSLAPTLLDRYRDYVDFDSLRRLNGAERGDYDLPDNPPNRGLRRPGEWLSVKGVREAVDPGRFALVRRQLAADDSVRTLNINTATPDMLRVVFDVGTDGAEALRRARETRPILDMNEFVAITGAPFAPNPEIIYTFPSGRILFEVRDARSAWIYRGRVFVTPGGLEQPLWIDQTELIEAPRRAAADTSHATRFPYAPR